MARPMREEDLQRHITRTYMTLRVGVAAMGLALPLLLWVGSEEPQSSMSACYHTRMGDVFVGLLFAIGACLYLYRGFSTRENIALNLAGILAFGVAVFPTPVEISSRFKSISLRTANSRPAELSNKETVPNRTIVPIFHPTC